MMKLNKIKNVANIHLNNAGEHALKTVGSVINSASQIKPDSFTKAAIKMEKFIFDNPSGKFVEDLFVKLEKRIRK